MGALFLEFGGEEYELELGQTLTFGRSGDLVIDPSNQYLHRVLGCFAAQGDVWFLQNLGRYVTLRVMDRTGPSRTELAPADQTPIGFEEFAIVFEAGPTAYEIVGALSEPTPLELGSAVPTDTVEFATLALNEEQLLLVATLAEPLLRGMDDWQSRMPGNKEVARRLGWSTPKFNRKLDYLCRRLSEQGVDGMQGGGGTLATTRRARLARHLVDRGMVVAADLDRLPPAQR